MPLKKPVCELMAKDGALVRARKICLDTEWHGIDGAPSVGKVIGSKSITTARTQPKGCKYPTFEFSGLKHHTLNGF